MRLLLFAALACLAGCTCKKSSSDASIDAGAPKRARAVPRPGPCAPFDACLAACDRGTAGACYEASQLSLNPVDGGRELLRAQQLAALACERGDGRGCIRATALPSADAPKLLERAVQLLPGQCDAGELEACELLVNRYRELDAGVPASEVGAKARTLATTACDAGDPFACARLGSALLSGWLGTDDPREGARLLERACDGGVAGACLELSLALMRGRPGLEADPARAARLRTAARELSAP